MNVRRLPKSSSSKIIDGSKTTWTITSSGITSSSSKIIDGSKTYTANSQNYYKSSSSKIIDGSKTGYSMAMQTDEVIF